MEKKKLLIASRNRGKIEEIKFKLKDLPLDIISLDEMPGDAGTKEVEETAETFEGNAIIKAIIIGNRFKILTLGDDSGLEVDALDGRPGVMTSRYPGADSKEKYLNLLKEMENVPDGKRQARFIGSIALYDPEKDLIYTCSDKLEGEITREPRGEMGFGYDPIFYVPRLNKTAAELALEEKSAIDHRGKALEKAKIILKEKFLR